MHKFLIKLRNPVKKLDRIFSCQRSIKTDLAMADPQIHASMDEDIEPKERSVDCIRNDQIKNIMRNFYFQLVQILVSLPQMGSNLARAA